MQIRLASIDDFTAADLIDRARVWANDPEMLLFRIVDRNAEERGLVVLDAESEESEIGLEEIFVAHEWRGHGVGCAAIALIEAFTRSMNRTSITVWPQPIESDDDDDKLALIEWYKRRGFVESEMSDKLEKAV